MKKQNILCSLFIILALFLALKGSVLATDETTETNIENTLATNEEIVSNTENTLEPNEEMVSNTVSEPDTDKKIETNAIDEARNLLGQMQMNQPREDIESIKQKTVIVIIAITIALVFILIIWKYEAHY